MELVRPTCSEWSSSPAPTCGVRSSVTGWWCPGCYFCCCLQDNSKTGQKRGKASISSSCFRCWKKLLGHWQLCEIGPKRERKVSLGFLWTFPSRAQGSWLHQAICQLPGGKSCPKYCCYTRYLDNPGLDVVCMHHLEMHNNLSGALSKCSWIMFIFCFLSPKKKFLNLSDKIALASGNRS